MSCDWLFMVMYNKYLLCILNYAVKLQCFIACDVFAGRTWVLLITCLQHCLLALVLLLALHSTGFTVISTGLTPLMIASRCLAWRLMAVAITGNVLWSVLALMNLMLLLSTQEISIGKFQYVCDSPSDSVNFLQLQYLFSVAVMHCLLFIYCYWYISSIPQERWPGWVDPSSWLHKICPRCFDASNGHLSGALKSLQWSPKHRFQTDDCEWIS